MKKLSVVVPVYNGANFIKTCVNSLLNQKNIDLSDIEILLINDGSKDSSLDLLKVFRKQYPKSVRVIDQANQGAAATRNTGIRIAKGEYLTLVDQDDWVDQEYLVTLLAAMEDDTEVAQVGYKLVDGQKQIIKQVLPIMTDFGKLLAIPAWAKIYKTTFLRNHNISFFENNIGEDSLFTLKVWLLAKKYKTISYTGYNNFFDNQTNVTNTLHKGLSDEVNIIGLLDELHAVRSDVKKRQVLLDYNIIRTAMYYLLSYGRFATSSRFEVVARELFDWLGQNIPEYRRNKYIWIKPKGEHLSASVGIQMITIVESLNLMHVFSKLYCRKTTK